MNSWIDSHAHLTMLGGADKIEAALVRAADTGVNGVLVPSTNGEDLDGVLDLAKEMPNRIVGTAGVHPHDAMSLDAGLKRRVSRALEHESIVGVGEIGLDYHYMNSPREDQLAALEWQLDLAIDAGLPVVLHNRESWTDMEPALTRRFPHLRGVCHSFTEGPDEARRVVELGLLVGISGMVTFNAAHNIREMAAALKPNEVLVETDSPFLAPVPHRGSTNEPAFVVHVGERLASELGIEVAELAAVTCDSFRRLFGLEDTWPVK
jgi:TatD DNase family protein